MSGLLIGAADTVPSISGATVALFLGIYDPLIEAIQSIGKKTKWRFLLPLGCGVLASLLLFSQVVLFLLLTPPFSQVLYLIFILLVGASCLVCYHKITKSSFFGFALLLFGFCLTWIIGYSQTISDFTTFSPFYVMLSGMIAVCATLLPGVSGGTLLIVMGVYCEVISAIANLGKGVYSGVPLLIQLGIGILIGAIIASNILYNLLKKYHDLVYFFMIGLMCGSIPALYKGVFPSPV